MLSVLPTEITLTVLSFLPIRQLHRLQQVSHTWNDVFSVNKSAIYHAAALLHGFVHPNIGLQCAKEAHLSWLDDVLSWKDLCKKHYVMERRWEGGGSARHVSVGAAGQGVHRFKIDDEQRTVITTHFDGGLSVCAIDEDEILWSLPQAEVEPFAHCEFAAGFLAFTRTGEAIEVWRRKRDICTDSSHATPSVAGPDLRQVRASALAQQSTCSITSNDRGAFLPWLVISPPNLVRASRLVYPTLLAASANGQEAYLYDVTSGRLTQTISLRRSPDPPVQIHYVELGERHIFVCSEDDIMIFPRVGNKPVPLLFPSHVDNLNVVYKDWIYSIDYTYNGNPVYKIGMLPILEESPDLVDCLLHGATFPLAPLPHLRNFTAVHVSPCGSHFVATDQEGYLWIVRYFEQALQGTVSWSECIIIIDWSYPITHLAFEGDKRIAVHVADQGIFTVPFVSQDSATVDTLDMRFRGPYPRVLHAKSVGRYDSSGIFSCIQLTRTELWYTWTKPHHGGFGPQGERLHCLDFAI